MARLKLKNDHNKFAILKKVKGQELFDSMVEFLQRSKIHYALTHSPDVIYESMVKQFWASARKRSDTEIVATIEGTEYVVTESLIRTKLQLDDENGVYHSNT
jgi:predicted DNA-binding protein with PD1-like motif